MIKKLLTTCLLLLCFSSLKADERPKVGLCVMATGRYNLFVSPLLDSARHFFCTDCDVTYFVFTDGPVAEAPDVAHVYQKRLGWPFDTMNRFHTYYASRELFREKEIEYIYALDADMRFIAPVGREIFSDVVATRHFGYTGQRGTYETNPHSRACVYPHEGTYYYAGAFYGGKLEKVINNWELLIDQVDTDLANNFIAIWHDESHLNRFFIDHPPTLMLPIEYCFPEAWPWDNRKIVDLSKNRDEMRQDLKETDVLDNKWWEKAINNHPAVIHDLATWWGNENAPSRLSARRHMRAQHYHSVLDVGCGFATDYTGFLRDGTSITYTGIDITPQLVERAKQTGATVMQGDAQHLPFFENEQFDVCYARHLLEHALQPKPLFEELIRVAKKEVLITFFIKPVAANYDSFSPSFELGAFLNYNTFSRPALEEFLRKNTRVQTLVWEEVDSREALLHIYLN